MLICVNLWPFLACLVLWEQLAPKRPISVGKFSVGNLLGAARKYVGIGRIDPLQVQESGERIAKSLGEFGWPDPPAGEFQQAGKFRSAARRGQ